MEKREKTERQRQEDLALSKALFWLGGGAVLEFLLFLTGRYYTDIIRVGGWNSVVAVVGTALKFLPVVGLILAAVVWFWAFRGKKRGSERLYPWALGGFFLAVAICSLVILCLYATGVQLLLYLVVPGVGLLALIYYIYQHEFFLVAAVTALGGLGVWALFKEGRTARMYAALVLFALLLAAAVVCVRLLQTRGGSWSVQGKNVEIFPKNANYAILYVTCGLAALLMICALVLGSAVSATIYYATLVAWALIMAVYYTVKLM